MNGGGGEERIRQKKNKPGDERERYPDLWPVRPAKSISKRTSITIRGQGKGLASSVGALKIPTTFEGEEKRYKGLGGATYPWGAPFSWGSGLQQTSGHIMIDEKKAGGVARRSNQFQWRRLPILECWEKKGKTSAPYQGGNNTEIKS